MKQFKKYKFIFLVVLSTWLGLNQTDILAQPCQCINCPGIIPIAGNKECTTTEFLYFVNGASSNALEDPFQGVCAVNLSFKADNIFQIEMYLISPGGDTVRLICPDAGPGVGVTALTTWNITFMPDVNAVFPDPGFSPDWTNYDPWETGANYTGTYHPCADALEDFDLGPVNGPWKLLVKNFATLNKGELLDFSIVFCDETGIECGCLAYAGIFPSFQVIDACQGSSKLLLDMEPNYNGYIPDTTMYNYTYVIAAPNNTILEFDTIPDLTAYPIGNYKVCGLSYLASDSALIIKDAGLIKIDSIYNEINSSNPDYCADLSKNCIFININSPPPPKVFNYFLCKDSCITFEGNQYCMPGSFNLVKIDTLGCTQNITLNLTASDIKYSTKLDTICAGEFAIFGTDFYNKPGTYTKSFKSYTGCDSIVSLQLTVIEIDLSIGAPDTINCINSEVLLEGIDINVGSLINYNWTASNGGSIISNPGLLNVTVDNSGTYTLTGEYVFASGKVCTDFVSVNVIKNIIQPELSTVPDQFLCQGDQIDLSKLNIKEIHGLTGNITYHSALPPSSLNLINPLVAPLVNTLYYAYFKSGTCEDILNINVFVNNTPQATVKDFVSVCNSAMNGNNTLVKFDTLILSGDATGFWVDSDLSGASGTFPLLNFSGVLPGTYEFVYFTQSAVPPCLDTFYIVSVIVEDCECPSLAILSPGDLCNNNAELFLNDYLITTESGIWTLVNSPNGSTASLSSNIFNGTGSIPGVYTIRFTLDTNPPLGCIGFVEVSFEIKSPPSLQMLDEITVCNSMDKGSSTSVNLNNSILSADKSGSWKDLDASGGVGFFPILDFNGILPGIYNFEYTTQSAEFPCKESIDTLKVIVEDCTCPPVNIQSATWCNNDGIFNLDGLILSGQTGNWSVVSNPPGVNPAIVTGNNIVINGSDSGVYGLEFILSNPLAGCQTNFTTFLNLIPSTFTLLDTIVTICNSDQNGNISTLNFSGLLKGGDIGGTWQQVVPSGASGTLPVLDFNGVSTGNYYFKYVTNSAVTPCKESEYTVRVIVEDCECPSVVTISPGMVCNDNLSIDLDDFKLTAEPGSWAIIMLPSGNNPANINANIFSGINADPGNYIVQFILQNSPPPGCPVSSLQTIEVVAAPNAIITNNFVVCNDNSSGKSTIVDFDLLIQSASSTGIWTDISGSGAQGTLPVLDFKGITQGKYVFRYFMGASPPCSPKFYDITIEVIDCKCPQIILDTIPDICNDGLILDLTSYFLNGVTTSWIVLPIGQDPGILKNNILQINGILEGNYILLVSPLSPPPPGCPGDASIGFNVEDHKSAGVKISDVKFCENSDTIIQLIDLLNGEDPGGIWSITPPSAGLNLTNNTLDISGISKGNYSLSYNQNNALPCPTDQAKINIEVLPKPKADAGADEILDCSKPLITIGGTDNPGLQNVVFNWSGGSINGSALPNPTIIDPGIYSLVVTDITSGCTNSDVVQITGSSDQLIDAQFVINQPSCKGISTGSIEITVVQGNPPYLYSLNGGTFQSLNMFQNLNAGNYSIVVEDASGCTTDTSFQVVSPFTGGLSLGSDTTILFGDSIQLQPLFSFNLNEIDTIIWNTQGYLSCTECINPFVKPFVDTKYYLTIITKSGCIYTADIIVTVKKEVKIYIPNVFSPDGDGINDLVEIFPGPEIAVIQQIQIFDRWGEQVFQAENISNTGQSVKTWDGKLKGKGMNPGVFIYFIKVDLIDGKEQIITGEFTLVK